ncbi:MAG: PhnD/SsuA/transferrin family substrate-binding protein, partial [Thermomicrobiales bacterium]
VDAAASTETTLYNLAKEGQIDFCGFPDGEVGKPRTPEEIQAVFDTCPDGSVAMLAMSDPIPNAPFSVRADLPQSLKQAIKDALRATPNNADFISATGRWFIDPNIDQNLGLAHLDNYYDPLREVAKMLDLDLKSLEG